MVDKNFHRLEESEKDHLSVLPIYITVLIAGADGKIDQAEINKALHLAQTSQCSSDLSEYYREVYTDYEEKLKLVVESLPDQSEARTNFLLRQLTLANDILKKLDKSIAIKLYASFKDLAHRIAEASGGFLGFGKIGFEESKYIELHMIHDPSL